MSEQRSEQDSLASGKDAAPPRRKGRILRKLLLIGGPLLVAAVALYAYLGSGRFAATDNAYVKADKVVISPQVAGPIVGVKVEENQRVAEGDVLFVIDDEPYRAALARAEAQLQAVQAFLESQKASYRQKLEELELARTNVAYAERERAREESLAERKLGSEANMDRARHTADVAKQEIEIIRQALAQLRAQLGGNPDIDVTRQAAYLAVDAMRRTAALDVEHTVVRAPFDGIASQVPTLGRYAAPGSAAMSVIADRDVWIEANYKETDLTHVEVGQPVTVRIDTYPAREWRGEVESISQATGAEFAVIPAQNATGNWVKIIQRIPVRIAVDVEDGDPMLRAGMSAEVQIDTGHSRHVSDLFVWRDPQPESGNAPAILRSTR